MRYDVCVQIASECLSFREYQLNEQLPLSILHQAILDFLKGRLDAVLFGAHAVNAYAGDPRATQDVDILSTRALELAEELRTSLSQSFHIAVRIRTAEQGPGLRIYQVRKGDLGNRHLVDLRQVDRLPASRLLAGLQVIDLPSLVAAKVVASYKRRGRPKAMTDSRDIAILLLHFPELKCADGSISALLADEELGIKVEWQDWVAREILPEEDDY